MLGLTGCFKEKHKLIFDGYGFESRKTEYAAGEKVTVYYKFIATDTDYTFTIDEDVKWKRDYDNDHGYIFKFTMPDHDVTISVESHNSMMYDPDANNPGTEPVTEPDNTFDGSKILFDYYEAVVATVGGDGYDELVLYEKDDDELYLVSYSRWGEGPESMSYCIVPYSVLDDCMAVVKEYKMADWKDGFGMTGKLMVVKFKDGDKLIRVSSEDMPDDGESAFHKVDSVISSAWGTYGKNALWVCPECGNSNEGAYCSECGSKKP